ncbi:MAG: methyltransferase domain-containing protein [Bacteroidales bacterium]
MKEFWDQKYSTPEYKYGKKANNFFSRYLRTIPRGKILLPGEGEGRNAVFAALKGWQVTGVDYSIKGKEKAIKLANASGVHIDYHHSNILEFPYPENHYDAVSIIFVHLPNKETETFYRKIYNTLKPGGVFFGQLYSKDQIEFATGGPKKAEMLYTIEELTEYLKDFHIQKLKKHERLIYEGDLHFGHSSVIDFAAVKPVDISH